MIAFAVVVAIATFGAGLIAAVLLTRLRSVRLQLVALALTAVCLPLAAVTLSGVAMFSSGHDMTILLVAVASSTAALAGALLVARRIGGSIERVRSASPPSLAATWRHAPRRTARPSWPSCHELQRDGRQRRGALRRAPPARRLGEPRPADAAREHAGDARGARGRACRSGAVPAGAARAGARRSERSSTTSSSSPHRRRRSHARAAGGALTRPRRVLPARRRGGGGGHGA